VEKDAEVGGLAGSFRFGGTRVERFYHHWFVHDQEIFRLIEELGAADQIACRPTRTGLYYGGSIFRLSTPLDVLRFRPLGFCNRVRLGRLVLKARKVKDWRALEGLTAEEWLLQLCGPEVYRVVWEPLLRGKFGEFASEVSAVWFWNKLKLRGGSRGKGGKEMLAYFHGGFSAIADRIVAAIESAGGQVLTNSPATALEVAGGRVTGVVTPGGRLEADAVIATPALPIIADLLAPHVPAESAAELRKIQYLANVCVVLELDRSLSSTYWLNVNDTGFPFVGVIEHTNLEPPETYGGKHIVYLSKYLPASAELYRMGDEQVFRYCLPHLRRMFPEFSETWVLGHYVWRAPYSQPVVVRHYGELVPPVRGPLAGLYIASMAQIYPEDRGVNYAIRDGRSAARLLAEQMR